MNIQFDRFLRPVSRSVPIFFCATVLSGSAFSQMSDPIEAKGVTNKPLGDIDLTSELTEISGRQLRARLVVIAPGGH